MDDVMRRPLHNDKDRCRDGSNLIRWYFLRSAWFSLYDLAFSCRLRRRMEEQRHAIEQREKRQHDPDAADNQKA